MIAVLELSVGIGAADEALPFAEARVVNRLMARIRAGWLQAGLFSGGWLDTAALEVFAWFWF